MTICYPQFQGHNAPPQRWSWTDRDAIIYALSVGFGGDPIDERALPFVYEKKPTCFGRAEGGCNGSTEVIPKPHAVPARAPDMSIDVPTRPDVALLYRLTGDRNPIHTEPQAHAGSIACPLLHGLCSFGMTCRAVLDAYADFDPARIASHQARFSSPAFPGEILTVDLWRDGEAEYFEARVKAPGVTVIENERAMLRSDALRAHMNGAQALSVGSVER